jgi:outer membrane receptor protein involved in Fe transport
MEGMMKVSLKLRGASAVAALSAMTGLHAQTGPTPAQVKQATETPGVGDIIVTAQKRSQKINDVGLTIATASSEQLKSAGVTNVAQLERVVPGFQVGYALNGGFPVFSLRGVSFNAGQLSAPPAVSVYVDEAALPYSTMTAGMLLDVERVEVLKGPQGTLFGQNSTGGSINIIAAKPTTTFQGGADVELNNFGQVMLDGHVSGPLTDTLRARLAVSTTQFGAWQHGYYLNDNKNGDQNRGAARLLLEWTPTDRLKISTNLNGNYDHGEAQQPQLVAVAPANPPAVNPALLSYPLPTNARQADIPANFSTRQRNSFYQGVVRADYDMNDDLTFTSITNYAHSKLNIPGNLDGTALNILHNSAFGSIRTINQEVRLTGKIPDWKVNYIIGANYENDRIDDDELIDTPGFSGFPPGAQQLIDYKVKNRAAAVFGNLDAEIVQGLTLTGGVRYTETKQTQTGCTRDGGNGKAVPVFTSISTLFSGSPPPAGAFVSGGCLTINDVVPGSDGKPDYLPISANLEQKEHNVSWRGGANYKVNTGTLLYATISRGYKAGTFPVQATLFYSADRPLKQEKLTDYEIGIKIDLFQRMVHINAAGFYYDYRDKQFYTFIPLPPIGVVSTLENIPKSKVKGVDVDFTANPINGLTLRGAMTYIKTRIGRYSGYNVTGQPVTLTGNEFNFAPPVSATFGADYKKPISSDLKGVIGVDGLYNSRTFAGLDESASTRLPAHTIFNARVGVETEKWSANLWIRNLTNKYYWVAVFTAGDTLVKSAALPRTFGFSASMKF